MNGALISGISLLVVSLLLHWASRRLRRRAGLPVGRVIYSDTRRWTQCPEPLYAPAVNLAGKPDYLVRKWKNVIPVEVKSSSAPIEPYRSHVLQLAAYCLLTQATYGVRPPYGLIRYSDHIFVVNYTPELEDELLDTIDWMREDMRNGHADRNHNDHARCRACSYAVYCDQKLV